MNKKKDILHMLYVLVVSLAVLAASISISQFIQWLLMTRLGIPDGTAGVIVSMVQGVVAAIAAGLVLYELRNSEDLNRHQTSVEEAQFILEYNRSFIENGNMTNIERYLECMMTGIDYGTVKNLVENRQDIVNYLVYLEGLASCVHGGILELGRIDDLFAYRFFLAMNHPEVQSIDLLPYATYYRGCFQLYDKWLTYRMQAPKYREEEAWDIPLATSALCYQYGYEKYATPEITTVVNDNSIIGLISQRECGRLTWAEAGNITVSISKKPLSKDKRLQTIQTNKLLRAMLKELLYNEKLIFTATYFDDQGMLKCNDTAVKKEFLALKQAKEILYREGIHFRQLNRHLKLAKKNLENVAKLIYQTDDYIYPDMFETEVAAVNILTKLLCTGKDSMFNLDNIYVCELNEEIIGLILWNEGPLNWSSAELRKIMEQNNVAYPSKLSAVEREYISGYSEQENTDIISILNVCVAKQAQKNGVGKRMLSAFLQEHQGKTVELCVLSKNQAAISLYSSCGFAQHGHEEAAYPKSKQNHTRITMRYY